MLWCCPMSLGLAPVTLSLCNKLNKLMDSFGLKEAVQIIIGSGAALALASGIYVWLIKGRVKIPITFDNPHTAERYSRHRIRVYNKGFKTLQRLVCYISFIDLTPSDIENSESEYANHYLVSSGNYVPIVDELLIWDTGESTFDLHPKQSVDVDLLHYDKNQQYIVIPSEQGYTKLEGEKPVKKARVRIVNIKEYNFRIKFCALDYHSKEYRFKLKPSSDRSEVFIIKYK